VNAANNYLWMGSGVAGAIKQAGGEEIESEALSMAPIEIGYAVVTSGGKLKAKYVIHAAVMGPDLQTNESYIALATISSLMRAVELEADSIAFPAFGTGVGGFDMAKCAEIMLQKTIAFLEENGRPRWVEFVLFGEDAFNKFADELERQLP